MTFIWQYSSFFNFNINSSDTSKFKIIFYTLVSVLSKAIALDWVVTQLLLIKVDAQLVQVSRRTEALLPHPPPGASSIVGIDDGC